LHYLSAVAVAGGPALATLPVAADVVRTDFARAASSIAPGSMDGREGLDVTPDMVALEAGKPVLRARSDPWGAKTATFLYRDLGALGQAWTLEICVTFSSPLLEQHAGLSVGTPEKAVKLLIGRPGQPYDLRLTGAFAERPTDSPAGYRDGRPLWLRLMRSGTQVWGFWRVADGNHNDSTLWTFGSWHKHEFALLAGDGAVLDSAAAEVLSGSATCTLDTAALKASGAAEVRVEVVGPDGAKSVLVRGIVRPQTPSGGATASGWNARSRRVSSRSGGMKPPGRQASCCAATGWATGSGPWRRTAAGSR